MVFKYTKQYEINKWNAEKTHNGNTHWAFEIHWLKLWDRSVQQGTPGPQGPQCYCKRSVTFLYKILHFQMFPKYFYSTQHSPLAPEDKRGPNPCHCSAPAQRKFSSGYYGVTFFWIIIKIKIKKNKREMKQIMVNPYYFTVCRKKKIWQKDSFCDAKRYNKLERGSARIQHEVIGNCFTYYKD